MGALGADTAVIAVRGMLSRSDEGRRVREFNQP